MSNPLPRPIFASLLNTQVMQLLKSECIMATCANLCQFKRQFVP
jgi:hypothetical protein